MIICICNAISESDLRANPGLIHNVGTQCGKCISQGSIKVDEVEYIIDSHTQLKEHIIPIKSLG